MSIGTAWIVDDDPIFIFGTRIRLDNNSFSSRIMTFKNGAEAWNHLLSLDSSSEEFPSVIFLDLNMPIMDGWEFMDVWNSNPISAKNITVYILTSSIDPRDIERAQKYSVIEKFIAKPLTNELISNLLLDLKNKN